MVAVLTFNLPEEKEDFELAQKGGHYLSIIEDLDDFLRAIIKYNQTFNDEQIAVYEAVRTKLWELRNDE
jgi:hypothetical protein